jgi:hypothetical protein
MKCSFGLLLLVLLGLMARGNTLTKYNYTFSNSYPTYLYGIYTNDNYFPTYDLGLVKAGETIQFRL